MQVIARANGPGQKSMASPAQIVAMKSVAVTYLLWILGGFGVLGLHRFYLGRWVSGLIWLFTGGLFFIGALVDLFLIPGQVQVENLSQQLLQQAIGPDRRDWPVGGEPAVQQP